MVQEDPVRSFLEGSENKSDPAAGRIMAHIAPVVLQKMREETMTGFLIGLVIGAFLMGVVAGGKR